MIRVTVELIPYGFDPPEVIGSAIICNTGGTTEEAKYNAVLDCINNKEIISRVAEKNIFHKRREGVWALLRNVLNNIDVPKPEKLE